MRKKTSSMTNKSKFPITAIFFVLALVGCTFVRYLQYSTVILPENGFFDYDGGFLNNSYYIFFGSAAGVFLLSAIIDAKRKCGIRSGVRRRSKSDRKLAVNINIRRLSTPCSTIGAILLSACGFLSAIDAIEIVQSFSRGNAPLMQMAATIAAALGYTVIAYVIFMNKKFLPITALCFLFIAACHVSVAALEFMQRTYIANLSSRLIILSANLLLALFFLCCGRIIVGSETRLTALSTTIFGYSLVVMILSDALSRLWYYYTTDGEMQRYLIAQPNNGFELPGILFIAQAVTVLWLMFALSAKKKNVTDAEFVLDSDDSVIPKEEIDEELLEIFDEE
jgi:hypothetical protein